MPELDAELARIVATVDELDELPIGSVILTSNHGGAHERFTQGWAGAGDHIIRPSAHLETVLPARLLWTPGDGS